MSQIVNQVLTLFFMAVVGVYAHRRNIIDRDTNSKLAGFLLNITLPFLIIVSFQFDFPPNVIEQIPQMAVLVVLIHGLAIGLAYILSRFYKHSDTNILCFSLVFGNAAFIGYPLLQSVFGQLGIFYTSIYLIIFNIFLWSYGVTLFIGTLNLHNMKIAVINPGIISIIIGLLLYVFSIRIPELLLQPMRLIGGITTPLSMIVTGVILSDINYQQMIGNFHLYVGTVLRTLLIPGLILLLCVLFGLNGTGVRTMVIISGTPVAAAIVLFAEKYNGNSELSSGVVALSTITSVVTLPFLVYLTEIYLS